MIDKAVDSYMEVQECICKEPTPRMKEIKEKTPPQIKISEDKSIGSSSLSSQGILIQDIDKSFSEENCIEIPNT